MYSPLSTKPYYIRADKLQQKMNITFINATLLIF